MKKETLCLQCTKCKLSFIFNGRPVKCPECGNIELIDSPEAKWFPVDNGGEEIVKMGIRIEQYKQELLKS